MRPGTTPDGHDTRSLDAAPVGITVELMEDGTWYGILYVEGVAQASSGRKSRPADVMTWLAADAEREAERFTNV